MEIWIPTFYSVTFSTKTPLNRKKNPPVINPFLFPSVEEVLLGYHGTELYQFIEDSLGTGDSSHVCCHGNGIVQHFRGSQTREHGTSSETPIPKRCQKSKEILMKRYFLVNNGIGNDFLFDPNNK